MKEFLHVLRRFLPPYKKYLVLTVLFNILSAVLNIFSFMALVPILQILFQTKETVEHFERMEWGSGDAKDVLMNNMNYYVQEMIGNLGPTTTLLLIGLFLALMTALKTGAYFLSSATIVPIRTGVVRDIRNLLYEKINSLPLGFFSEERKGDIIARMTGDVQEIENSIMSSLDMLFKNPILILAYFVTLVVTSWQLTLFAIIFVPVFGWFMGFVGRKLKQKSTKAQALWSDTMSQVEETLGALRIEAANATQLRHHGIALRSKLALVRYMLPTATATYTRKWACRQHAIGRRRNELDHVAFAEIALVAIDFDQGDISRACAVHEYGFAIFRTADARIAIGKAIDGNSFWHSSSFSRETF